MKYSFSCYGHENITSKHKTTFEFTKDSKLGLEGDCIIGIKADFSLLQLKEFIKSLNNNKITIIIETINEEYNKDYNEKIKIDKDNINKIRNNYNDNNSTTTNNKNNGNKIENNNLNNENNIIYNKNNYNDNNSIKTINNYNKNIGNYNNEIKIDNKNNNSNGNLILKNKIIEKINAEINPKFNSDREMVIRKTGFVSERTFAIKADKAAFELNKDLVEFLKINYNKIRVVIENEDK